MQGLEIPQGMRDILMDESEKRTILTEKLLHYMQSCGLNRIETPLFEYYELFSGDITPVDDENIIKSIDRDGRVVVLRPDLTIPSVRVVATKLKKEQKPLKLCYMGNVYRADGKIGGTGREICQVGAEIYGSSGKWLDIETIGMAEESFKEAGVKDYKIDIGHGGIIKGIFEELSLPEEKKACIIELIGSKNLVELEKEAANLDIDSRYKKLICKLPLFFGKPEEIFKSIDEIIVNARVREAVDYLFEVYEVVRKMGPGQNLIIDAGMTGNMKYYTGLIFRAYAQRTGDVVISGGRYDRLLKVLGVDTTAAGFAIYVDGMVEAAQMENSIRQNKHKVLVVYRDNSFIEALEYSRNCRKRGKIASLINRKDVADPAQYCKQYGYDELTEFE